MVAKRGRPVKNTNTIRIDDLDVEFFIKKKKTIMALTSVTLKQ